MALRFPPVVRWLSPMALVFPLCVHAQERATPPAHFQVQIQTAQQDRQQNLARVKEFFSSDLAKDALRGAKLKASKVQQAASLLSDSALASLARQTDRIQTDFAAGRITSRQVSYIIVGAIAIAVLGVAAAVI